MKLKAIDRISAKKEIFKDYYQKQIPCVFTDFTKDWGIRDWDYDYLKSVAGEDVVDLYGNPYQSGQTLDTYTRPEKQLKFSDYLDLMAKNEENNLRMFLFNIFKLHPELLEQITLPEIGVNFLSYRFSFFGTKNSATRMHFDIDYSNVFLSHFLGRKKVLLFDRSQSYNLYRIPYSTHSLVDFSRLDEADYVAQFPNLEQLEGYEVVLEPGETLYMPSAYWHYITYVDSSFSVALRSLPAAWTDLFSAANNVFVKRNLTKVLNMSPSIKKLINDYKLRRMKERYADQEIVV